MTNEQLNNGAQQVDANMGVQQQPPYTTPQTGYAQQPVQQGQYVTPPVNANPTTIVGTSEELIQPTQYVQQPTQATPTQNYPQQTGAYAQPPQQVEAPVAPPVQQAGQPQQQQTFVNTPVSPNQISGTNVTLQTNDTGEVVMAVDIVADIGNSGSRVVVDTAQRRFYFELDNKYAHILDLNTVDPKYFNKRTTIIKDTVEGYYANGQLVDTEYPHSSKPVGFKEKAQQHITYVTLRTIIARATLILAEYFKVPVDSLQLNVTLHVLFPPLNAKAQGDLLNSNVVEYGLNRIEINSPVPLVKTVNLQVMQKAEGISGWFASFYEEAGVERLNPEPVDFKAGEYEVYDVTNAQLQPVQQNIPFHEGDFLVIDIGGGTSDLVRGRNMEIIESSRETIMRGGNAVEARIKQSVRKNLGMTLSPEHMTQVLTTGRFVEGTGSHNVIPFIQEARTKYADSFIPDLVEYFDAQMYDPRHLKGLLIIGGGALETSNDIDKDKADAMVKLIIDYLKRDLCPNVSEIYTDKKATRRANVNGATILARY